MSLMDDAWRLALAGPFSPGFMVDSAKAEAAFSKRGLPDDAQSMEARFALGVAAGFLLARGATEELLVDYMKEILSLARGTAATGKLP